MLALALNMRAQADPAASADPIPLGVMRKAVLEDAKPYEVAVGAVPTTILMPGPIEAFEGNHITTKPDTAANVFLEHQPGTRFFSVKALYPGMADLNVILGDSVYSFRFYYSENSPTRTLTIASAKVDGIGSPEGAVRITARRLYDILQDAKTYFAVKEHTPNWSAQSRSPHPAQCWNIPATASSSTRCSASSETTRLYSASFS